MGLIYIAVPKTLADATAVVALHLANKDPAISIHISRQQRSFSIPKHDQALHICSTETTNIIQQDANHSMNLTKKKKKKTSLQTKELKQLLRKVAWTFNLLTFQLQLVQTSSL